MKYLLFILLAMSCGREPHVVEKYVEVPTPPVNPGTTPDPNTGGSSGEVTYKEMQGYLTTYCVACHSNSPFMQGEQQLKASSTRDRIWSRSMPPANAPKKLPEDIRKRMLIFFQ